MSKKLSSKQRIKYRIRNKVNGTAQRPRLSVYRSNKNIYCQLINDIEGVTIASANSSDEKGGTKIEQAAKVGSTIAEKAKSAKVETVIFDRGGNLYHGRVKALADAAREGGLKF